MLLRRRTRRACRVVAAAALFTISLAGFTAPAGAAAPAVLDPNGVSVAAYGGWAAWSRLDMTTNEYALVVRSPQGAISLPAVAERATPFDVELGPGSAGAGGSAVAAVYSRCADSAALRGCHLVELGLGASAASERPLAPPGGGSNHEPAIWKNAVVFLRRDTAGGSEDPTHPGRKPDGLFAWSIGSRKLQSLQLPVSSGNRGAGWPRGLTGLIAGLTFNGKQLGYATSNLTGAFGETTLWFEPLSGRPELIDQETSGAGNVCQPQFVSPVLSGPWLYAYLHACDPSANAGFDRLTRYRHGEVQSARYRFISSGDEAVTSAVPDGTGADWDANGVQRLVTVSWRKIAAPIAQTFCSRPDPFC
jgi:hypothetical protein